MGGQRRLEMIMDSSTRKWLVAFCRDNYWRVAPHIELEDLVQDGFVKFHTIRDRYRGQGRTHAHLINTFKVAFRNHVNDLSNYRTRQPLEIQVLDVDWSDRKNIKGLRRTDGTGNMQDPNEDFVDHLMPRAPEEQTFAARLATAPFRVREALAVYASEEGRQRLCVPYRMRADGTRESLNDRLCRLAGFDPTRVSLVAELRGFLAAD